MSIAELLPRLIGFKLESETKMAQKLSSRKEGTPVAIVTNAFKLTTKGNVAHKYAMMSMQRRRLGPAEGDAGFEQEHP